MTTENLWEHDEPIISYLPEVDVPAWISPDISPHDIAAIVQGGCESGAYMPAVTYWQASNTMHAHGDDVLQFIQDSLGELPRPADDISWQALACHYLSCAVELWAHGIAETLAAELPEPE